MGDVADRVSAAARPGLRVRPNPISRVPVNEIKGGLFRVTGYRRTNNCNT
jgi:hypothetical protein